MNARFAAPNCALISPDRVRNEMQKILRFAQTKFTDEQLADLSGVDARAIKSYRVEGREPSLSRALSLLCVLGGGDLNRILNTIGYCARPLDESDRRPCGEVVACILEHGTTFARAAADGRVDHTEEPAVRLAADNAIEALLPYSSAGAAA
jgi:hypothetical protein